MMIFKINEKFNEYELSFIVPKRKKLDLLKVSIDSAFKVESF